MSDLLNDVSTSCTAAQGKLELSLQRELPSCDDYRIRCDALKQLLENLQKKQSEVFIYIEFLNVLRLKLNKKYPS